MVGGVGGGVVFPHAVRFLHPAPTALDVQESAWASLGTPALLGCPPGEALHELGCKLEKPATQRWISLQAKCFVAESFAFINSSEGRVIFKATRWVCWRRLP